MKDPIRIHHRQLDELKRLLADRVAPKGTVIKSCQNDTAAKVTRDSSSGKVLEVDTARPLMSTNKYHYMTFCECKDWPSKWREDREWCLQAEENRFYDQPYNFKSNGQF